MKQINITEYGGPEVLQLGEGPKPELCDGEVMIKVHAAGVNRPDVVQRQGNYAPPPGASLIPGLEVAGVIEELGTGVEGLNPGVRVCALIPGGGYAEYVSAIATHCLPVPENLDLVEASALPETTFTVWHNVFERGALAAGESLLIHGGSSGIGTTAIQIASARGHRVFVTAGTAEKCKACSQLGADVAINYREQDFVKVIQQATDGRGVDVILDMVGGDYIARNIRCAAEEGRIVSIAFLRGVKTEVNFAPIMLKRLTLTGSTLRPRDASFKTRLARSVKREVWPLLDSGKFRPVIHRVFPLQEAAEAHALMESNQHIGKIVLTI